MIRKPAAVLVLLVLLLSVLSGCFGEDESKANKQPSIFISYPHDKTQVSNLVMISGTASDPNGNTDVRKIEVRIEKNKWLTADGTTKWSFDWNTYNLDNGIYTVQVRAWDGALFSEIKQILVEVDNPESVESDSHKWAIFIAASNFPEDNESKLGNGGLYLAEEMAAYFIEECHYATSNIIILFDDGWIRTDNGYGEKIMTLQQRRHEYDINYGGATRSNVEKSISHMINESNKYRDSEIFLWVFNHGYGDETNKLTGGKIFESSAIFLWDDILSDRELGELLLTLKSRKTCIIIDACYCGGFADKTIFNLPTSLLFRSGIPRSGRIVIAGASKFRKGYASTTEGPLFTLLWFDGILSGDADGFKPGLLNTGRPSILDIYKDGKVSVEEAFFYARYVLRTNENLEDYESMEPQMTDRYPYRGFLLNNQQMILGEN